jgi:hypothetical protein
MDGALACPALTQIWPSMRPAVLRPDSTSIKVVLPAPDTPMSAVSTPGRKLPLMLCSSCNSPEPCAHSQGGGAKSTHKRCESMPTQLPVTPTYLHQQAEANEQTTPRAACCATAADAARHSVALDEHHLAHRTKTRSLIHSTSTRSLTHPTRAPQTPPQQNLPMAGAQSRRCP